MVLDRSKAPPIHDNIEIKIPQTQRFTLRNGIEVHEVNLGTQNIIKLEIVFLGGRTYEAKKLAGRVTASLIKEATAQYNSAQLAEEIDFYGATILSNSNMDHSNLVLICLKKHFEKLLDLVRSIWVEPLFPSDELIKFKRKVVEQLKINLSKNEVLAYRDLTSRIFGDDHPYGFNSTESLYSDIERDDLINHYNNRYFKSDTGIFISGKVGEDERRFLDEKLGTIPVNGHTNGIAHIPAEEKPGQKVRIKAPQEYQTAIRIGKKLFTRHHEDYPGFYFMNIIFGGYFGSRLMKNIREDKAFTYGIHSYIDTYQFDGYYSITTEVGNEYLEATLKEIYFEVDRLKQDLVDDQEFVMAKNYLLGQFLNMMDGPMKVSQILKTVVMNGLDLGFVQHMIEHIKSINKQDIREMAIKHLSNEELWEVTARK